MTKESLARFNEKLMNDFGYFGASDKPRFRLVWSEDQIDKRLTHYTKDGFQLNSPIVVEVKKYAQWIHEKYLIEMLCEIPSGHEELTINKLSYENIWTFEDKYGHPLEPRYDFAKFMIENLLEVMTTGKTIGAKYKVTNEEERQQRIVEIDKLEEMLYGNESKITDALMKDSAVGYGTRRRSDNFDPTQKITEATQKES